MKRILLLFIFLLVTIVQAEEIDLYGANDPRDYLSGRFNPKKHKLFVSCKSLGIPTDGRGHYLRRDTAVAFASLVKAFNREHPNIRLYVSSSTRNFWYQKSIWDGKFFGKRKVGGKNLMKTIPDTYKRALKILNYSSMPGTSRHHWGSDLDVNKLVNSYYDSGEGKIIYDWLKENASRYGFYQVYTEGREGGYYLEKWHWSYLPVSKALLYEWIRYFGNSTSYFSGNDAFGGSEYADRLARYYVETINPACK